MTGGIQQENARDNVNDHDDDRFHPSSNTHELQSRLAGDNSLKNGGAVPTCLLDNTIPFEVPAQFSEELFKQSTTCC